MATEKQKQTFNKFTEKVRSKKPIIMGQVMREGGYSLNSSLQPSRLTSTLGWQELLKKNFPDSRIQNLINKALKEYELEDKIADKRSFLGLVDLILKLKDKYPANKIKQEIYDQRDAFFIDAEEAKEAQNPPKEELEELKELPKESSEGILFKGDKRKT